MALDIKDGDGDDTQLKTTETAGVHTPHHNVDSSALPTGAATSANQATEITALGTLLTTTAFQARVPTVGQAAMAASSPVVIASNQTAVPVSGTVSVGGTVGISGAALTALELIDDVVVTEDAAHGSGDKGIMPLAVRRDANTTLADASGDYAPLQVDSAGSLKVAIISGAGSGGTSATDDAAFSVAAGSGTPIMGFADESGPDSVDEGDVGVVRMTLTRALHTNLRDASGNQVAKAEDSAHTDGDPGLPVLAVRRDANTSLVDTTGDYAPLQVDSTGNLKVAIISGGGSGGTSATDDAAFTPGAGSVTPIGAMLDNSGPDSVDEGDVGVVRMQANRALHVVIRDNAGNERGLNIDASGNLGAAVASVVPGTAATNLGKAEDAPHSSGDVGVMPLAVRNDTMGTLAATNGDYVPFQANGEGEIRVTATLRDAGDAVAVRNEDTGASAGGPGIPVFAIRRDADTTRVDNDGDYAPLQVNASGSLKVAITAGAGSGGTSMTDDAAFTPGTTAITPMGAMFDDVAPDSVNEGDGGVVRMSANRNLYSTIRDAAGNERGLNVDANGAIAIGSIVPGTGATNLGKAEDAAHTSADVGVMALAVRRDTPVSGAADGDYTTINTDANGRLHTITASQQLDDAAFTPATSYVSMVGATFDDVSPDSVNEGDGGAVRMSANRNLYITIRDAAGNERGMNVDSSGAISIGSVVPVSTATLTNVSTSTASAQLLAATTRKGFCIWNDAAAVLYVKYGTTASATSVTVPIAAGGFYEDPWNYQGRVDGILASSTGTARITELT